MIITEQQLIMMLDILGWAAKCVSGTDRYSQKVVIALHSQIISQQSMKLTEVKDADIKIGTVIAVPCNDQ